MNKRVVVGSAVERVKCTRRTARTVKRNVKFLLNRVVAVPFIARNVFLSARIKAAARFSSGYCFKGVAGVKSRNAFLLKSESR